MGNGIYCVDALFPVNFFNESMKVDSILNVFQPIDTTFIRGNKFNVNETLEKN